MVKKTNEVVTTEIPATLIINDGKPIPMKAVITSTYKSSQIRGRLIVDFEKLRESGELSADDLYMLQRGYPEGVILLMGILKETHSGKTACIGIKTGPHVYPKNMFWISVHTLIEACVSVDEPPHEVEPY